MSVVNNKSLKKRLMGYTTLAGAMIAAGPSAQAAVIKTDPADQSGLKTINIDFNNDFTNELDIKAGVQTGVAASDIWATGNSAFVMGQYGVYGGFLWYGSALNYGVTIGASKTFATSLVGALQYSSQGYWAGASQKFLGVKFILGANTHYGWIKLSCTGNPPPYTLTIYEFAYENTPDLAIQAGSDVSLPVQLASFIANPDKDRVKLQWMTQSEIDNLGFILERQLLGETSWTQVASYLTHPDLKGQGSKTTSTDYEYVDATVQAEQTYRYRLSDVDVNGDVVSKKIIQVDMSAMPDETDMLAAYPNPFNPGTTIQYNLSDDAPVTLDVIDITGRTVRSIVNEQQAAGSYAFSWDGMDNAGQSSPSGVYMLVLRAGDVIKTQKVTRLK